MKIITYGIGGYDPSKPNNNIADAYEIPDPVVAPPDKATPATIRIAMRRLYNITGQQFDTVVAQIIAAIPNEADRQDATDLWQYAVEIQRTHPLVAAVANVFGLSQQQIDDAFRFAATI
jgi:hypothetical protein